MKTKSTLTLVLAGLLFLTTPLLAMAGDHQRNDNHRDYQSRTYEHPVQQKHTPDFRTGESYWSQFKRSDLRDACRERDRLQASITRIEYDRKHNHRYTEQRLERELRDARRQLQLVMDQIWRLEHNRRGPERHQHEHYASHDRNNGTVIIGLPNIAVGFNW